ncbi:MAG: DUF2231 domain-containing protein [Gemmatimonadota bacterium]|nr:DUF2231 domain-containing protein [Gemmatimonadota bacterium]
MLSKARIGTHPIHTMLVAYPLGLWTTAVVFDAVAKLTNRPWLHIPAYYMILAGCVGAVAAAIPGLIDLFGVTQPDSPARRTGWIHALLNISALVIFAFGEYTRHQRHNTISPAGYYTDAIGLVLIAISGWLGGALVYDHKVGVPYTDVR